MTALETFARRYADRWNADLLAGDWKNAGRKVVGYTDINCPEEMVMAAGCLPLLMTGDPRSGLPTVEHHMDTASALPVRYLYEAILTGRYDFIDLICSTGGDRWISLTDGFLSEEKRLSPALKFGQSYFIERLRATFRQHRDFNLDRLFDFKAYLEDFSGRKITDEALSQAFAVTNETKRLLQQVSALRKADAPAFSGCQALQIIMASMLMPKAEYNALLARFLDETSASAAQGHAGKVRLFVSGSNMDNLQLYEIIESLEAVVVGEDTAFGDRYFAAPISAEIEPMEAIADRYTYKPLDPWMLGLKERIRYRVESALAARAQGEIYFHLKNDDCAGWDYPDQKAELEKNGIPVLVFEDQDYQFTASGAQDIRARIAAFIADLRASQTSAKS